MLYKQASLRLKWLDIAKGITIILMVIGHTSIPDPFSRFIYAFHMPLFFIASGWTTNWNKYNYMEFAKRKFRSIMVPFMVYSVIVLSIQTISMGGWNFYKDGLYMVGKAMPCGLFQSFFLLPYWVGLYILLIVHIFIIQ